jgi:hypothetical protein
MDTTCPRCGKALSPTGYSRYGEPEPVAPPTPPLLTRAPSARVAGIDRPRNRDTQIQAWRYYVLPVGVVVMMIIAFVIFGGQSKHDYGPAISISPPYVTPIALPASTPTAVRPFACTPPAEATLYPETMPISTTPTVVIGFTLDISTTKGLLKVKMYYPGTSTLMSPLLDNLSGSHISIGNATVTFNLNDNLTTGFAPIDLPYQCGRLLLPVRNGQLYFDELTIIKSNDGTNAVSFAQALGYSYTAVGQLISGYDVLRALTANDSVITVWWSGP